MDALTRGTLEGLQLVLQVTAMLLVFVALVYLVNAILGVLLVRALGQPQLAVGLGGLYAVSDEVHQSFVRGRHGAWYDVVIDTIGVAIGVLAWRRARRTRR